MTFKNDSFCLVTLRNDLFFTYDLEGLDLSYDLEKWFLFLYYDLVEELVLSYLMTLKMDLFCLVFIYWHVLHALWHVSITYMYQNNKHTTMTFRSNSLVYVDTALQDNKMLQKHITNLKTRYLHIYVGQMWITTICFIHQTDPHLLLCKFDLTGKFKYSIYNALDLKVNSNTIYTPLKIQMFIYTPFFL